MGTPGLSRASTGEGISPKERADPIQIVPNVTATTSEPFTTKQLALQLRAPEDSLLLPGWFSFLAVLALWQQADDFKGQINCREKQRA